MEKRGLLEDIAVVSSYQEKKNKHFTNTVTKSLIKLIINLVREDL